jgi:hypothetical protein
MSSAQIRRSPDRTVEERRTAKMKRIVACLIGLGIIAVVLASVQAYVPRLMSFQGRLTDDKGKPLDGSYEVTFRIYDVPSGGSPSWVEVDTLGVETGFYATLLGEKQPLDGTLFTRDCWLELQVTGDGPMYPRYRLATSPFAFRSARADTADYAPAIADDDWVIDDDDVYRVPGNVGIGTDTPSEKLQVDGTVETGGFKMAGGAAQDYVLTSDASGTGSWQPAPVGGLVKLASASFSSATSVDIMGLSPDTHYLLIIRVKHGGAIGRYYLRVNGDVGQNYQYGVRWVSDNGTAKDGTGSGGSGATRTYGMLSPADTDSIRATEHWNGSLDISTNYNDPSWTMIRQHTLWDYNQYPYGSASSEASGFVRHHGGSNLSYITIYPTAGTMTGEYTLYRYE